MGKIKLINNFTFEHSVDTDQGSSGSPVILISNCKLVGIHKKKNLHNKNNCGTFIGFIIKEIQNNIKIHKKNIITEEKYNHFILKYQSNNDDIRIFGQRFFLKNKNNCKMIIDGKEQEFCDILKNNKNFNKVIEIKLIEYKTVNDMSYLFFDCKNLLSVSAKWDITNVSYIDHLFENCINLNEISGISN
jgi:hypothetical protein